MNRFSYKKYIEDIGGKILQYNTIDIFNAKISESTKYNYENSKYNQEKIILDIKKIKSDILISRYSVFGQIFNSISIVFVSICVLIYFQIPQIKEQNQSRENSEKVTLAQTVITILSNPDKSTSNMLLKKLNESYPNHPFIRAVLNSQNDVDQLHNFDNIEKSRIPIDMKDLPAYCVMRKSDFYSNRIKYEEIRWKLLNNFMKRKNIKLNEFTNEDNFTNDEMKEIEIENWRIELEIKYLNCG